MKKRPSDRQMEMLRRRHAIRAIRETVSYSLGWPDRSAILLAGWEFIISKRPEGPDWYGWLAWLGHPASPRLSFDPYNDL
jgi:hypothetical protein